MFQDENVRKVKPAESPQTRDIRTLWPRARRHDANQASKPESCIKHSSSHHARNGVLTHRSQGNVYQASNYFRSLEIHFDPRKHSGASNSRTLSHPRVFLIGMDIYIFIKYSWFVKNENFFKITSCIYN